MTIRARSGGGRSRRSSADNEARQKILVTLGFIGVILTALVILGASVAVTYYNDHLKAVATVDGVGITRDRLQQRAAVLTFKLSEAEKSVREDLAAGKISKDTANQELQLVQQQQGTVAQDALNELVNQALVVEFAGNAGVTYSDADLEAELTRQSSTTEKRHVLAIFVVPQVTAGADTPTDQQRADAKAKADAALAALTAGTDFATVAKQYSNDASKEQGGDFGDIQSTNGTDRAWVNALFALPSGGTTSVIEGSDGTFRIGRVTQITAAVLNPAFRVAVQNGPGVDAFKDSLVGPVLQRKMTDKLVAQYTTGSVDQVHVYEILIPPAASGQTGGEIRASHILYSPKHDPQGASALPSDDPGWAASKALADAEAAKLNAIADVTTREKQFAIDAAATSDDQTSGAKGGDLGWFTRGAMVQEFSDAVFVGAHNKGDVIGPVKSQFGWHLILFEGQRGAPADRAAADLKAVSQPGADFSAVAKAESSGIEASKGGDLGWIIKGESSDLQIEQALFALQPGQVSAAPLLLSDGYHIYKVTERATKPVTGAQIDKVYTYTFSLWFNPLKAAAKITYDSGALPTATP
jgi:parvulin-like peptidyl-prolyl isomerase